MFGIIGQFWNRDQGKDFSADESETRIIVLDDPPPEFLPDFLEKDFAELFNFLVLESNSPEIGQFFDGIAEKRGIAQYLWVGPTNPDGTKRVVLAYPTGKTDHSLVLSGHRSIIRENERFRDWRNKFPVTTHLIIIGFNVEKESEFRKIAAAINPVYKETGKKKLIMCYQDHHMWYLVIGTNKSTV